MNGESSDREAAVSHPYRKDLHLPRPAPVRACSRAIDEILQEFYVAVYAQAFDSARSRRRLRAVRELAVMPIVRVDVPLILAAVQFSRQQQLSFWDALVVRAAIEGGASTLYSEDLQHGQVFETLGIENPMR